MARFLPRRAAKLWKRNFKKVFLIRTADQAACTVMLGRQDVESLLTLLCPGVHIRLRFAERAHPTPNAVIVIGGPLDSLTQTALFAGVHDAGD